eukprot:CAMPEP_0203860356 /NCGR_PEP_ID=MMETSP0359-20131031/12380_1 /ASSEMBLY_ACC=CAM_ASM_000338 /TAXON_ID=268821 /ORGANISM="Scrippsiella Hangoei, Strain SHTV-5" /LENGTH=507 /DNA_ID=CAMNT_0050777415 /DNA_START=35 /DNA_END=1558 /DNA_ORIENTATION=+
MEEGGAVASNAEVAVNEAASEPAAGPGEGKSDGKAKSKSKACFNCGGDHLARDCPEERRPKATVQGDGVASGERLKELVVPLFGADRNLGSFPTKLHSDLRHLVEMCRRGKLPRLDASRVDTLQAALAASPSSPCTSLAELRGLVECWRSENRSAFDAESYYDGARTAGYTEKLGGGGSQENLARRALQLCSLDTSAPSVARGGGREGLLAVDLGCGSGLSTFVASRLPGYNLGVIGVDLSSEMLRSDAWQELTAAESPLAAERVRCDLAQPLPFRPGTFDVAYSVAAVHYLAQDSLRHTAAQRLDTLLGSLRSCLQGAARPCTFQAFFTREPKALKLFTEASERMGWALCDLVLDRAHGGSGADRDFLYLVAQPPPRAGPSRPPRCALHRGTGATCAVAVEAWAESRGVPPPRLDASHREWLCREHERFAKRLVRLQERCGAAGADGAPLQLDHAAPPDLTEAALARRLAALLKVDVAADAARATERQAQIIAALHGSGESWALPP